MTKFLFTNAVFLSVYGVGLAYGAEPVSGGTWWDVWYLQVCHAINLVIFLAIIVKFAGPSVVDALKLRSENIGAEITEAARLHQEAEQMLADYDARLASLESEANAILDEYRNMGEQERDRIIGLAQVEADRIRSESVKVAESEFTRAKERIEAEVVDRAIDAATEAIVARLSDEVHDRLTSDYFVELESSFDHINRSEA